MLNPSGSVFECYWNIAHTPEHSDFGKEPKRVGVFSHDGEDLFGANLSVEDIEDAFTAMRAAEQHTFLILTHYPQRLRAFVEWMRACSDAEGLEVTPGQPITFARAHRNVWFGVRVESQKEADTLIPELLAMPAAVRLVWCNPREGAINLSKYLTPSTLGGAVVDGVIVGGGWGPTAKPMHPAWVLGLRDQCTKAGASFFFEGWGEWVVRNHELHGDEPKEPVTRLGEHGKDTRVEDAEDAGWEVYMQRVGAMHSGRELEGRTWDDLPSVSEEGVTVKLPHVPKRLERWCRSPRAAPSR